MIDPRVDTYIEKAELFAQPILKKLRSSIHNASPEIVETIKWGFPNFEYKGSILCSFASFKHHCSFGFWLGSKMEDPDKIFIQGEAMGNLGKLKSIDDLPSEDILRRYFQEAMILIENGEKLSKNVRKTIQEADLKVPGDLDSLLNKHPKARTTFDSFSRSNKKEYITWIEDAKTQTTREKRIATTIEFLSEGKTKNWKYERK
ncbi:MAG: hypothetical protein EP305_04145 [Bacteroidetes bacterium]|nr:MAG: hypothetical protein EP305_04145 [Bacteroidota bacterium]